MIGLENTRQKCTAKIMCLIWPLILIGHLYLGGVSHVVKCGLRFNTVWGFNNGVPTYPPLGWLIKQSHFLITLPKQGGNTWHKYTTMWKTHWGLSHHGYNPTSSKITFDNIKEAFFAREWNSFHFFGKKLDYLHLKDFLKYKCELHLKQPINTTTMQDHCCLLHLES
jgi:hypothetical protein